MSARFVVTEWFGFRSTAIGGHYASAMLNAYFSRLEHLLVVSLPFTSFDPTGGGFLRFVAANWDVMFETALETKTDRQARAVLEDLRDLKEGLRNPLAHGGFAKKGASFFAHIEGLGAVPTLLRRSAGKGGFRFTHVEPESFDRVCARLDRADRFIEKKSRIRMGWKYARTSLPVALDADFRQKCATAATSKESMDAFIDARIHLQDMVTNVDY